jgi:hypothetical protein
MLGPVLLSGVEEPVVELTVLLVEGATHFALHPASSNASCGAHADDVMQLAGALMLYRTLQGFPASV